MPVMAGPLLTQGLKTDFVKVYTPTYEGVQAELGEVFWLDATSDKLREVYAYLETAPYPVRWDRGNIIASKAMKAVQWSVVNRDWGRRIPWHVNDRADDQTSSLFDQVRDLGRNWGTLIERCIYQIITGTTDGDLLPALPVASDGISLFSSASRYGVSGGNVLSSQGTSTIQQIITGLMNVYRRNLDFKNTESQPLWNDREAKKFSIFYGTAITLVMNQALTQMNTYWRIAGSSATNDVSTQSTMDNVLKTAALDLRGINSQRITDSQYYCFLRGLPNYKKPIFWQVREPFFEAYATWDNSDRVRDTGEEYLQFKSRGGAGIPVAYAAVNVSS